MGYARLEVTAAINSLNCPPDPQPVPYDAVCLTTTLDGNAAHAEVHLDAALRALEEKGRTVERQLEELPTEAHKAICTLIAALRQGQEAREALAATQKVAGQLTEKQRQR